MTGAPSTPPRWQHDLRNQLGIILGFSELLIDQAPPSSALRADLVEIHQAATRALGLLDRGVPPGESERR